MNIQTNRIGLFLAIATVTLAFTACIPNIFDDGSYDMTIQEISNPQLQGGDTTIDVRVVNRGCPPQSFIRADVDKAGNNIKLGIRYQDGDGVSTCATFDEIHTVNLGELTSGDYFIQARNQAKPSLTITVP